MLFREERALLGALGWWAFDIAVLWACFHAFGEPPPVAVFVMAYFTGMLANLLPLPGGVGYVEGGMIAALLAFWVPGGLAGVAVLKARRWPDRRSRAPRSPAAGEPRAQRHGLDTATQRPLREHLERGRGRVRGRQAQLISDFYAARARRDWVAVRELLATDVIWHEAGDEDYSGDHRGRDAVTALLQQLVEVTDGSFRLDPSISLRPPSMWRPTRDGAPNGAARGSRATTCRLSDRGRPDRRRVVLPRRLRPGRVD
jgi:hypothetical protein